MCRAQGSPPTRLPHRKLVLHRSGLDYSVPCNSFLRTQVMSPIIVGMALSKYGKSLLKNPSLVSSPLQTRHKFLPAPLPGGRPPYPYGTRMFVSGMCSLVRSPLPARSFLCRYAQHIPVSRPVLFVAACKNMMSYFLIQH